MKVETKIYLVEENQLYKIFINKWYLDEIEPAKSVGFDGLPLTFKEHIPYGVDGSPVFSLTKSEIQELVNELCNKLGFKPEAKE